MRYTRPRGSQFALWPLFVLAMAFCGKIGLTGAQNQFGDEDQNQQKENVMMPLPTGKWNQFNGFYTPRPLPSNAHFTFASVWASWSAWSYCTNNIQIRVRACNTVRGFSCLGPNRELRPCEHSTLPPNRVRQFQVRPPNNSPIGIETPSQYEAEDPWADDRKEAMKQLYSDYEGSMEALNELKKEQKNPTNLEPIKLPRIGPPGIRPAEAFGSKLVERKEIIEMKNEKSEKEDSLEQMNLDELAEKLEVKEPKELAEKLSELETVDADTEKEMAKITTTTMKTPKTTMQMRNTTKRMKMGAIRPKVEQSPNRIIRPKMRLALPFTTTSTQPPTRTTMVEPKYRQSKKKVGEELMRPRVITNLGRKDQQRKSGEMEGKLNESILVTPKSAVAEDTAKALEWIVANMSKSIESAQKSRGKSEEQIGGSKFPLHSGELMVDSKENEEVGKTLVPKKHLVGGGSRAMAVNSYRMAKNNENGGGGNVARMRHRERLIKELAKAQKAKQRQIERSREQIEKTEGNDNAQLNGQMERELAKLKAEMRAMEAVLARMKSDASENAAITPLNDQQSGEIMKDKKEDEDAEIHSNPVVIFPTKVENQQQKKIGLSEQSSKSDEKESAEITARILPPEKNRRIVGSPPIAPKTTTIGPILSSSSQSSLILTEQPESIWLAGSVPRAGAAIWSKWGDWGECICGKQMRSRSCHFEDSTFHPQGCIGPSYESRQCTISAENCPTTIAPSKQQKIILLNERSQQSSPNLRPTSLSIAKPIGKEFRRENDERRMRRFWWIK